MVKNILLFVFLFIVHTVYGQLPDTTDGSEMDRTERIIRFHSDIAIYNTGKIQVAEHITVYANGDEIKRGIVRRIPIYRKDKFGSKKKVDINVLSVLCNGEESNFKTETADGNREIYVGSSDTYLDPGVYEYLITYESYGQVGFFDTFDELYWNVTGNEWNFTIEEASASITLPDSATMLSTACYTGEAGSTEKDCSVEKKGNQFTFSSNHVLYSHQGFTIAVSFPRDIIKRPPPPTPAEIFWDEYKSLTCGLIGILLMFCFFLFTWKKVGVDPEKPVVIPLFKPPHDWSPAVVRYLYKKEYDDKIFTATIVNMAVKKNIRILQEGKKEYRLEAIEKKENLAKEEGNVYDNLFAKKKTLKVSNTNHSTFFKAITALTTALQTDWNLKDYFRKNLKYIASGGLLMMLIIVLYAYFTDFATIYSLFFTLPFIVIGLFCMIFSVKSWKANGCGSLFMFIFGFIFTVPIFIFEIGFLFAEGWFSTIFILLMLISFGVYIYLIKAPTELGAQTSSELEGFKMYLKTAEEDRLNMLTPPERTPELFEKLLPYAMALGVENEWTAKFDKVLKEANYQPEWYSGNDAFLYAAFAHSFTGSFSSSVSSAKVDPTSSSSSGGNWSSGSGGGGSSGGGGGGGGGGGW